MGLPVPPPPSATAGALDRYAAERATGALRGPHGCFYLVDGAVTCVECPAAPGLEVRLAASGRVPAQRRREAGAAVEAAREDGHVLVRRGLLTQGELEICHLAALLDAAFFALSDAPGALGASGAPAGVSFVPGATHRLGGIRPLDAARLQQATARRRALLGRLRAWAAFDAFPVRPLPAASGRVPLTSGQRLLLAHADGRLTPYDLARALGRSAFMTLLDVRRLASAGLIGPPATPATLPRRQPGACLDGHPPAAPRTEDRRTPDWHLPVPEILETADPDIALLVRLRTALEENL